MLLNPKDFANAVGISYDTLRKHIQRKKLFKSGDYIDTDFQGNVSYIQEQTEGRGLDLKKVNGKPVAGGQRVKKKSLSKVTVPELPAAEDPEVEGPSQEQIIFNDLSLRKKHADAEKAERESRLKELEIQKKMGELMPIDMVEKILAVNIQTVFKSLENECENIASVYCEILGGDRTHLSDMTNQMRESLQKTIREIKEKAADEVQTVIKEYAEVRGRGQKK